MKEIIMKNFTIPKKDNLGYLREDKHETEIIYKILTSNYALDKQPYIGINSFKTQVIYNKNQEEKFVERKTQLKKSLCRVPQEMYGFLFVPANRVEDIAKNGGIQIGNIKKSILGSQDKGVHLFRFSDICLLESKMYAPKYYNEMYGHSLWNPNVIRERFSVSIKREELISCLVIFKVLVGKVQTVDVNGSENDIDPSPLHDMHLPDKKPALGDKSFTLKRDKSLLYTYDYDMENMSPYKYPRSILPYAVIHYSKQPKLKIESHFSSLNSYTKSNFKRQKQRPKHQNISQTTKTSTNSIVNHQTDKTHKGNTRLVSKINQVNSNGGVLKNKISLNSDVDTRILADSILGEVPTQYYQHGQSYDAANNNFVAENLKFPVQQTLLPQLPHELLKIKKEIIAKESLNSTISHVCNKFVSDLGLEKGFDFSNFIFSIMLKLLSTFTTKFGQQDEKKAINKTLDLMIEYITAFNSDQESEYRYYLHHELQQIIQNLVYDLHDGHDHKMETELNQCIKTEFKDEMETKDFINDGTQNSDPSFYDTRGGPLEKRKVSDLEIDDETKSHVSNCFLPKDMAAMSVNIMAYERIKSVDPRIKKRAAVAQINTESPQSLHKSPEKVGLDCSTLSVDNNSPLHSPKSIEEMSPDAETCHIKSTTTLSHFNGYKISLLPIIIPLTCSGEIKNSYPDPRKKDKGGVYKSLTFSASVPSFC